MPTNKSTDLGLDHDGSKGRQRSISADGSFNVERIPDGVLNQINIFRWLNNTSWLNYWLLVFLYYGVMNVIFATIYFLLGPENLNGIQGDTAIEHWLYCFFFSAQSFTTVGYGSIHPISVFTNFVATFEAFIGLMTFALATGTLYGRFSKPVSRIKYSDHILIAPFKSGTGMQFMIANRLDANLMEMEARVNISYMGKDVHGQPTRKYQAANLEIDKITMFPTNWTINHPIDEKSILWGKSLEEIKEMDVEVFVLIKGFDDVFSQTIYSKHSFTASQFVMGAKFTRPFYINENGKLILDLKKVGQFQKVA